MVGALCQLQGTASSLLELGPFNGVCWCFSHHCVKRGTRIVVVKGMYLAVAIVHESDH